MNLEQYVKERDEVILSLDKEKIMKFSQKYGIHFPNSEKAFWAGVHKTILHINASSDEQKRNSWKWLIENGFSTDIY